MQVIEGGKKSGGERSIYPVSPRSRSRDVFSSGAPAGAEIVNEIEGGLTLREYIAIEFASAMLSNPAFIMNANNSAKMMLDQAVEKADALIGRLEEKQANGN